MGGVIYSALGKYPGPATAKGRRNCVAALRRLAKMARQSGITLGLEAVNRYESNLINTGDQACAIIAATGADNIVVHLDTYHMNIEEGDLAGAIERCGSKCGYVHIGESHRGYLGTGTVDFLRYSEPHPHRLCRPDHLRVLLLGGRRSQPVQRAGGLAQPLERQRRPRRRRQALHRGGMGGGAAESAGLAGPTPPKPLPRRPACAIRHGSTASGWAGWTATA
jgi:hypothetical protein